MKTTITYTDLHTAGEPVRIVTSGYPPLVGETILDKRREARQYHDHLRRALMFEPRGHSGMYGVIPVEPTHPEALMGVLFTHLEGYSTMCGHAMIALGRWAVDQGLVPIKLPITRFAVEAPCGLVRLSANIESSEVVHTTFENVPAFVEASDVIVEVPGFDPVSVDLAYGGAYYAILPSSKLGLEFFKTPVKKLVRAATAITDRLRATLTINHPEEPDLGFLYGTILTDDASTREETFNLCVFADGQIDRSPTGSGVTARMAVDYSKGLAAVGHTRIFRGISGEPFTGEVKRTTGSDGAVIVEVGGRAFYGGSGAFTLEADDPFRHGLALPDRFEMLRGS